MQLVLYGLAYSCWACGEVSTPLVALALGETQSAEDLVICDYEPTLRLADELLPDEVRRSHRVGSVRERYTKTSRTTYLANECFSCRAVFGRFPLFHEALSEVLALDGVAGLVDLGGVEVDAHTWRGVTASRWR